MITLYKHTCPYCNNDFSNERKGQKFCNRKCSGLFNYANGKKPPVGACKGHTHSVESKTKMSKSHIGINNSPWAGGKRKDEIRLIFSKANKGRTQTLAARKTRSLSMMGKNVTHGNSKTNIKLRKSIENRLWREAVFALDNYTCQRCNDRGGRLHAHHKKHFSEYPELRFAINNGETLCIGCHALDHPEQTGLFKQVGKRAERIVKELREG